MKLKQSKVVFNEVEHTYSLNGRVLQGITPIVAWMFPDTYQGISQEILNNAASRGSHIHKYCQIVDSLGLVPDDCPQEVKDYMSICGCNGLKSVANEYLVSDNKNIASSIDVVFTQTDYSPATVDIADIKTTSSLHKDNVRLQLSLYAYLFELNNKELHVRNMYAIWLPKQQYGKAELVEIGPRIDSDTCKSIIKAYVKGEDSSQFHYLFGGVSKYEQLPAKVVDAEKQIISIDAQLNELKVKKEQIQTGLLELMKQNGVKKYESDRMIITYVAPAMRASVDGKKLKDEHPDIYESCIKESIIKESVRIKIK